MSRDWTREELNAASEMMKQNGHMGFEAFCHALRQNQPVSFELSERSRKELVKAISEILSEKAEYMRMPPVRTSTASSRVKEICCERH